MAKLCARQWISESLRPVKPHHGRRMLVVLHSSFGAEPLERAIQSINRILSEHEQRRQKRASRAEASADVEVQTTRPVTFKASAKTEKLVKEPNGAASSSRGLSAYLSLPLDQYSLLDPGWISRCPGSPDMFVLRIPLFDLVGLELQPQISVRVAADPRNSQVHFLADQFKLGDSRFDADLQLAMRATLRNKPVTTLRPLRSIKRMWSRTRGRHSGREAGGAPAAAGAGSGGHNAGSTSRGAADPAAAQGGSEAAPPYQEHVIDVEGSDGDESGSSRREERYNPGAVLDVGMGGGAGGLRGTPDLPPHVSLVSRDGPRLAAAGSVGPSSQAAAAMGSSSSSSSGASASSQLGAGTSDSRHWDPRGIEPSKSRGAPLPHYNPQQRGVPGSAGAEAGGLSSRSGLTTQEPPSGAGPSGPSTTAQLPPAEAPGASFPVPGPGAASTGTGSAPSVPAEMPSAAPRAEASGAGLWRRDEGDTRSPQAPGVRRTESVVAPAASRAAAHADASGPRPFIEDSVLYVPASQWGKPEDAAAVSHFSSGKGSSGAGAAFRPAATLPTPHGAGGDVDHARKPELPSAGPSVRRSDAESSNGAAPVLSNSPAGAGGAGVGPAAGRHTATPPGAAAPSSSGELGLAAAAPSPASVAGHAAEEAGRGPHASANPYGSPGLLGSGELPLSAAPETASPTHIDGDDAASVTSSRLTTRGATGSASEEGATALLVGSVDVAITVMVPPALAAVPRPLLGMTGSLIARYAISSLLPSFLDLLASDYGRWSSGQTVAARAAPVGDLAATAAANAAAMGGSAAFTGVHQVQREAAAGVGARVGEADAFSLPPSQQQLHEQQPKQQ